MHVEAQLLEGGTADIANVPSRGDSHRFAAADGAQIQAASASARTRLARYAQGLLFTIALIWLCLHGANLPRIQLAVGACSRGCSSSRPIAAWFRGHWVLGRGRHAGDSIHRTDRCYDPRAIDSGSCACRLPSSGAARRSAMSASFATRRCSSSSIYSTSWSPRCSGSIGSGPASSASRSSRPLMRARSSARACLRSRRDNGRQVPASASAPAKTYRYVVLPQAVRIMLPPLTSIAVSLIKDSAIVSVIAVSELTTATRNAISATFMSFESLAHRRRDLSGLYPVAIGGRRRARESNEETPHITKPSEGKGYEPAI